MSSLSIAVLYCSWISSGLVGLAMDWARTVCAPAPRRWRRGGFLVHCGLRRVPDFRAVMAQQIIQKWTVYNLINDNVNAH